MKINMLVDVLFFDVEPIFVLDAYEVVSKNDGDLHYIDSRNLSKLYNLHPKYKTIAITNKNQRTIKLSGVDESRLIWLEPLYHGNYETYMYVGLTSKIDVHLSELISIDKIDKKFKKKYAVIYQMHPMCFDTNGRKIETGDRVRVDLRNNTHDEGIVFEEDGLQMVQVHGNNLNIRKCYRHIYTDEFSKWHKKCGYRYAIFTIIEKAPIKTLVNCCTDNSCPHCQSQL